MRAALPLPLAIVACLAGCLEPAARTNEAAAEDEDICTEPWSWPYIVEGVEKSVDGNGTRVLLEVAANNSSLAVSRVQFDISWGADAESGGRASGKLEDLTNITGAWSFRSPDAVLSNGDTFVGSIRGPLEHADWHLVLRDADGRFLGGSPSCM